jgi:hypothetical protein
MLKRIADGCVGFRVPHSRVLSKLAVTTRVPSGLKEALVTVFVWRELLR